MPAVDIAAATGADLAPPEHLWRRTLGRLARRKGAMLGLAVISLFVLAAIFAPYVAPYDPLGTNWALVRKPMSWAHPFGTDEIGRDVFSRVIWGARASLLAGIV